MKTKGALYMLLSAVGFGMAPILMQYAYAQGLTMFNALFFRFLFATAALALAAKRGGWLARVPQPKRRLALRVAAVGGLLFTAISLTMFLSMRLMSVSVSSILYYIYPVWVGLFSAVVLRQPLSPAGWLCVATLLGGYALTLDFGGVQLHPLGVVLALASSGFACAYVLYTKRQAFLPLQGPLMSLLVMAGATAYFGLCCLVHPASRQLPGLGGFGVILVMALVSSLLAMTCFFMGSKYLPPVHIAAMAMLEPVVTLLADRFLLGRRMPPRVYAGMAVILVCITVFVVLTTPGGPVKKATRQK